jgi:hypothetical protein
MRRISRLHWQARSLPFFTVVLQIMLDASELKALDDWRFHKRMPSRAAAVRELIRRGLAAEGFAEALSGQRSSNFGIVYRTGADASDGRDGKGGGQD